MRKKIIEIFRKSPKITPSTPNPAKYHIYFLLYKAVRDYINALAPVDNFFGMEHDSLYHACIIAKNSQCVWHVDKNNLGGAVLTTLGDFTGGELLIESIQ